MEQEYLRKSQIKREYNISYTTLAKWEKQGLIKGINGILFTREEVEKAINRPRKKPGRKPKHIYTGPVVNEEMRIVEISEDDLFGKYLAEKYDDIMDFPTYKKLFKKNGCKIINEEKDK